MEIFFTGQYVLYTLLMILSKLFVEKDSICMMTKAINI